MVFRKKDNVTCKSYMVIILEVIHYLNDIHWEEGNPQIFQGWLDMESDSASHC
jgi:hypothetical protein